MKSTFVEFYEMGYSSVRCALSIRGGAVIAVEDHGLPHECLLNCFLEIIELFGETSGENAS